MRVYGWCGVSCVTLIGCLLDGRAYGQVTYQTVALTGQQAPGAPAGVTFAELAFGHMNNSGQVTFTSWLAGPGVSPFVNDFANWAGSPGTLQMFARNGDPAPGLPAGVVFDTSGAAAWLGNDGNLAVRGRISGPGVTPADNRTIWSGLANALSLVAREGDPAPGTDAGVVFAEGNMIPVINGGGKIAFTTTLSGTGVTASNNAGVWSGTAGSLQLVARSGSAAPATPAGVNFGTFFENPVINGAGQVGIYGSLSGTGVTATNDTGLWIGTVGSVQLIAREGDAAPETPAGVNLSSLRGPGINDAGQVAFGADLVGAVTTLTNSGIWAGTPGSIQLVVREGMAAPGTSAGVNFGNLSLTPVLNGAGEVIFIGQLVGSGVTTSNDRGIWIGTPGSLRKIFREGDAAPGTGAGVVFSGSSGLPAANALGQVAFQGVLGGTGVTTDNDRGVWATDLAGNLLLVVREGDSFDVNEGPGIDLRTIAGVSGVEGGGEDGRGDLFTDSGQIFLSLDFTDGTSGIFIASVPEPSALGALALAVMALQRRTRRSRTPGRL